MINIEDEWLAALNVRRVLPLLIFLALLGHSQALPTGVNDKGNDGCLCHGGSDESTIVTLSGLPEVYNSSQGYLSLIHISEPTRPY